MTGRSPLQPSTIGRPALEQRLDAALGERRLTCVVAGPGFGKTTLLSHWAETTPHAMSAWHGVTTGDRTLSALVRAVTDALAPVRARAAGRPRHRGERPTGARHGHRRGRAGRGVRRADLRGRGRGAARAPLVARARRRRDARRGRRVGRLPRRAVPPGLAAAARHGGVAAATPLPRRPDAGPGAARRAHGRRPRLHRGRDGRGARGGARAHGARPGRRRAGGRAAGHDRQGGPRPCAWRARPWLASIRPTVATHWHACAGRVVWSTTTWPRRWAPASPGRSDLLVQLAVLDRFTPELADALGPGDHAALAGLVRRGLVVDAPGPRALVAPGQRPAAGGDRRVARRPRRAAATLAAAAPWFADHDQPAAAVRCSLAAGADDDAAGVLVTPGARRLLRAGEADVVLDVVARVPDADRSPAVHRLEGDARQLVGDWDVAVSCYERAAADPSGSLDPGLAWRWGLIHHLRGDLDTALVVYGRGRLDDLSSGDAGTPESLDRPGAPRVLDRHGPLAPGRRRPVPGASPPTPWSAPGAAATTARWRPPTPSRRWSPPTTATGWPTTPTTSGPSTTPSGRATLLQIIRIRLNRGSRLNEEGFHDEAIAELDLAIGLADLGGYGSFKAIALCNRGEARGALGRFDEALDDVQSSKAIFQRMGSLLVAYPLGQAADLHAAPGQHRARLRGLHRGGRRRAPVGRPAGPRARARRAWPGSWRRTTPTGRAALADEAVGHSGGGLNECGALLAQAWVAHAAGDVEPGARRRRAGRRHRPRPARSGRGGRGRRAPGRPRRR